MIFYERFFAQHKTFVLKIAIFFIYLLIIYPACPARGKKSDDSTCTSHRFFFLSAEDASRAERSRVSEILLLLQKASPPDTFSFACQKRTRKAPATFEAREARIKGCSPLIIPKQLGSIQKIQVAALEDFLCCADFKSLTRRTVWQGCVFFLAKIMICKLFMNPIDKVGKQEYSFSSRTDRVLKQVKPVRQEVLETVKQLKNSRCFPFGSISAPGF